MDYTKNVQVYLREFPKTECKTWSIAMINEFLLDKIKKHPIASHILTFDHWKHTKTINGEISKNIIAANNIIFCFGKKLPDPNTLAVRPRSIGICETDSHFVITFTEATNLEMTSTMLGWVDELDREIKTAKNATTQA
jgi:hypothetical protein